MDDRQVAEHRAGARTPDRDVLQMRREQVDSVGHVAANQRQRLVDGGIREIDGARDPRARQCKSAGMHEARRVGVAEQPRDEICAHGAVGPPILALRGIVGGVVRIVAGTEPRYVAQRRGMQKLSFGGAERVAELFLRHRVQRGIGTRRRGRCGGDGRRRKAGQPCYCDRDRDGDCSATCEHWRNQRWRCRGDAAFGREISAARCKMQPAALAADEKKPRRCDPGAAFQVKSIRCERLPARATANNGMRRNRRTADNRVIDIEAEGTGFVRIVQPDRHRIGFD